MAYLEKRWNEGCHNRSQLWRELRSQGTTFAAVTLRRWFRVRLGVRGHPRQSSRPPPRKRPSPRQTSALLLDLVHSPSPSQQRFAQTLCALSPDIVTTVELAKQFHRMMRERDDSGWSSWRKAARKSPLHHFVAQLHRDEATVRAALTLPWSTGPVEGHISSTEADQTSDVRAGETRLATDPRVARGLIGPFRPTPRCRNGPPSPKMRKTL